MLGITLKYEWTTERMREEAGVTDVMETIKRSKWQWAGHVAREEDRWIGKVTRWKLDRKQAMGRPKRR